MDTTKPTVNTTETAVPQNVPAVAPTEDLEAKVSILEAEKARLIEETSNWKLAALKAKGKKTIEEPVAEEDDDKMRRLMREEIANSRLAEINREQDVIIKKALKENKELKLAQLNRTTAPTTIGTSTEAQKVQDTLVTTEQVAAFKARGWTDKDIERYKKNFQKAGGGTSGR